MDTPITPPSADTRHRSISKGVALSVSGMTALTGGGLLALGSAASAQAQDDLVSASHGIALVHQDAEVLNLGLGLANSGLNAAVGNASSNNVGTDQTSGNGDSVNRLMSVQDSHVLATQQTATASNASDGTAAITTGAASATGNSATTSIGQSGAAAAATTTGIAIVHQDAEVANIGIGVANSGLNLAVGNASQNNAATSQSASGSAVAVSQTATASNASDGTARITTGAASATGNDSTTSITQG